MSSRIALVVFLLVCSGCHLPWRGSGAQTAAVMPMPQAKAESATSDDSHDLRPTTFAETTPQEKTQEEAMAEVLDELAAIGAVDEAAKQQLIADLKEAKSENWSLIVRQFRSALAYRQQLAERERRLAQTPQPQAATHSFAIGSTPQPTFTPVSTSAQPSQPQAVPVSFDVQRVPTTSPGAEGDRADIGREDSRTQSQLTVVSAPARPTVSAEANLPEHQSPIRPASYTEHVGPSQTWQDLLGAAVEQLQAEVQPHPSTTEEVHQHMQLRLLQLLTSGEEAALQPIPGTTAAQHDYWSKQLFALATYLDNQAVPDDKRRAAAALMYLDQCRAKLAESATMQVRELAFVDSVKGYGDYEPVKDSKFRPGQEVTLYAEIENFTSQSSKEGYRTRLGTSYEVVDKNGHRVDSAQFPEIEDLCRSPRRDFHMQYTIVLPTRIYAERYELRLIIMDQQSQKIGQASLPFEIVED